MVHGTRSAGQGDFGGAGGRAADCKVVENHKGVYGI